MKNVFSKFINFFRNKAKKFPDKRKGRSNATYKIEDIVLSAFSIFYVQSPSFLQYQKNMEKKEGRSNAESLFGVKKVPSDNHIRDILDNVEVEHLRPMYDKQLEYLENAEILDSYIYMGEFYPTALDGTQYHSSKKIHCKKCLTKKHNETVRYSHQVITPTLVSPFMSEVIPLMPEFIKNKDGSKKQDCEINASKRWLKRKNPLDLARLLLGDDLYSREPFCREVIENGDSFIFTAKDTSHVKMYEYIKFIENTAGLETKEENIGRAHEKEIWKYEFVNEVPINGGEDALKVNWFDLKIFDAKTGKQIYHNSFVTNIELTQNNIFDIALVAKSRWKVENENNNTLKTKGYHLEHNFGHGEENLSELLLAMNILAFLFHTVIGFLDKNYAKARTTRTRERFFNEIEIFTTYIYFFSWERLMAFMARGNDSPMLTIDDLEKVSKLTK